MTKSEFLKQYKGMLVGAVGVFIICILCMPSYEEYNLHIQEKIQHQTLRGYEK
jgi:cell division protein FtsX